MDLEKTKAKLLRLHRFQLVRQDKHKVYKNHERKVFVCSSTPSDRWALDKQVADLRRIIAQPPRAEILAIDDFEKRDAERVAARVALEQTKATLAKKRNGGSYTKTNGTGFYYDDVVIVVPSKERLQQTEEDSRLKKEERQRQAFIEREFVTGVVSAYLEEAKKEHALMEAFLKYVVKNQEQAHKLALAKLQKSVDTQTDLHVIHNFDLTLENAAACLIHWMQLIDKEGTDIHVLDYAKLLGERVELHDYSFEHFREQLTHAARTFWKEFRKSGAVSDATKNKSLPRLQHALKEGGVGIVIDDPRFDEWLAAAKVASEYDASVELCQAVSA